MQTSLAAALVLALAPSPRAQQAAPAPHPWTLLVYGAADNNADGPILEFLDQVRKAIDDDPGIELLLFLDRSTKYSDFDGLPGGDFTASRLLRLHAHSAE